MKKIADYLHLYLGCECQLFWRFDNGRLEYERNGVMITVQPENKDQHGLVFKCKTKHGNFVEYAYAYADVKPILRPLSDMSEEEAAELNTTPQLASSVYWTPEGFRYLLSKHFDLFGLIPAGLAIDKTTLK